jgi:hypothetical protein
MNTLISSLPDDCPSHEVELVARASLLRTCRKNSRSGNLT